MSDYEIAVLRKGEITFDLEEAKKRITERTEPYQKMVFTEESIKDAKDTRAALNKERTAFDNERKAISKEYKKPLEEFESKVKEVLSSYDTAITNIDKQLKEFEKKRIEEKQEHLHKLYDDNIGVFAEYLPYEVVAREQWNNTTYTDKAIIADISEKTTQVRADLESIKALNSEFETEVIAAYKKAGNQLAAAIKRNQDYINAKAAAEQRVKEEAERKAREEEERKAREEAERAREEEERKLREEQAKEAEKQEEVNEVEDLPFPVEETFADFRVYGDGIEKVRRFLQAEGIDYKEV